MTNNRTAQPIWEYVCNLGDVNVADDGGFIVYRDATGVYLPEVEMYETDESGNGGTMYRFILEPPRNKVYAHRSYEPASLDKTCDSCRGYHWHNAWYVDKLAEVASSAGTTVFQLMRQLLSKDPKARAIAYRDIVGHFGPFEFDQYPIQLTEDEAQKRYAEIPKR